MSELRWNPLLNTWTMVAANRQKRPDMPKNWCPFCPSPENDKVPADFDVLLYPNDFPVLSASPEILPENTDDLYRKKQAAGQCDVVLYSPKHEARLHELPIAQIEKLVHLWKARSQEMAKREEVKSVFIFENRGKEVGVTMPHPHGQIYSYPFVPLQIETKLRNARTHFERTGRNLFAEMVEKEKADGRRVLIETELFLCFIPFFTDYPFGAYIVSKDNAQQMNDFSEQHCSELAQILQQLTAGMDALYDKLFPYMMCIYQAPQHVEEWANCADFNRFHIAFYPPLRGENSIKHLAASETGGWAAANTVLVEKSAEQLREAIEGG